MMNYENFGWNGGMTSFGWSMSILLTILLVLGIAALWKYIHKK